MTGVDGPPQVAVRTESDGLTFGAVSVASTNRPNWPFDVEVSNLGPKTITLADATTSVAELTYGPGKDCARSFPVVRPYGLTDRFPAKIVPGDSFVVEFSFEVPDGGVDLRLHLNLNTLRYKGWTFIGVENTTGTVPVQRNPGPPFF